MATNTAQPLLQGNNPPVASIMPVNPIGATRQPVLLGGINQQQVVPGGGNTVDGVVRPPEFTTMPVNPRGGNPRIAIPGGGNETIGNHPLAPAPTSAVGNPQEAPQIVETPNITQTAHSEDRKSVV